MATQGYVTIDGNIIGSFEMTDGRNIVVDLHNKRAANFEETLEFANEEGMTLALVLKTDFNDEPERCLSA